MVELAAHGDRTAIRDGTGRMGYRELDEAVTAQVGRLAAAGLASGQRVTLACRSDRASIVRALAVDRMGCTVLPLDASLPAPDRERHARVFDARWRLDADGLVPGPGAEGEGVDPEPPAQALCSSGSSGTPKIVLRSRAQVEAGVRIHTGTLGIGPEDRVLAVVSLGHSYGFNSVMLGTLDAGGELVLPASGHPRGLTDALVAARVTRMAAPPVLLDLMARFHGGARPRLPALQTCLSVGEGLSCAVHEAFRSVFGVEPWQSYGASEAGPVLLNRDGAVHGDAMALGTPYDGVEVGLEDDRGEPMADGETGEIVVRSPAVGLRYEGQASQDARIHAGRFHSGDLACRVGGRFHFSGRKKLLIASAGRKISPEEVEGVLGSHPDVADAAVVGRQVEGRERPVALVVLRRPRSATDLLAFCAERLAAWKVPAAVELRDELPRGASGKVLRAALH